jgi:hypothetical protein
LTYRNFFLICIPLSCFASFFTTLPHLLFTLIYAFPIMLLVSPISYHATCISHFLSCYLYLPFLIMLLVSPISYHATCISHFLSCYLYLPFPIMLLVSPISPIFLPYCIPAFYFFILFFFLSLSVFCFLPALLGRIWNNIKKEDKDTITVRLLWIQIQVLWVQVLCTLW